MKDPKLKTKIPIIAIIEIVKKFIKNIFNNGYINNLQMKIKK